MSGPRASQGTQGPLAAGAGNGEVKSPSIPKASFPFGKASGRRVAALGYSSQAGGMPVPALREPGTKRGLPMQGCALGEGSLQKALEEV